MNESAIDANSSSSPAQGSGGSIFAAVRAVLLGFVILMIGGAVSGALMFTNLKLAPAFTSVPSRHGALAVAVLAIREG